ncbi:MAG: methyltransferase domain-containing protein [Planctomycetes bacterium]|nr:methyltransferase domain-containing protein [Planctomycetota bacterium]
MAGRKPLPVSLPSFWESLYETGDDGWDLGRPAPPLVRLLREAPPPGGRVAVPGCGRGHDVALWRRRGFDVVGFDFSARAVAEARRRGRNVERRDVFLLGREFPRAFDVAWEYTCFCAIDPARRAEYVDVLARILRKGGELIALFYPLRESGEGPPFPVRREEIESLLARGFRIESAEAPRDSVERRRGCELLVRARRRR